MVLLGEFIQSQQSFNSLTTSIPTLDNILHSLQIKNKIYDFQSSPSCNGMYIVISSLIISHLKSGNPVIIIDTLNKFPFHFLKQNPEFNRQWISNITHYSCNTFAKLYGFLITTKLPPQTMLIINEFHELLKTYKLELSSVYEDIILKHHIDMNATLIENKSAPENEKQPIPELPINSDLLKTSPVSKYESHVNSLISNLKNKCINENSLIFLLGYLDTKFRPYKAKSQDSAESSSFQSFSDKGRVVLSPSKVHKSVDLKIVFYHDWYHNSLHFQNNHVSKTPNKPITIEKSQLKLVYVAEVTLGMRTLSPAYFDTDSEFYYESDDLYNGTYQIRDLSLKENNVLPDIASSQNVGDVTLFDGANIESSFILDKAKNEGHDTDVDNEVVADSEDEIPVISSSSLGKNDVST